MATCKSCGWRELYTKKSEQLGVCEICEKHRPRSECINPNEFKRHKYLFRYSNWEIHVNAHDLIDAYELFLERFGDDYDERRLHSVTNWYTREEAYLNKIEL